MDIGSAKLSPAQQQGIPHYLIDVIDPPQRYSVYDFQNQARQLIADIGKRGHLPMVVGGTGLYIKALLYDYDFPKTDRSLMDYSTFDNQQLYQLINEKDPVAAAKLHVNNRKRLLSTLKLLDNLPIAKTEFLKRQTHQPIYDALVIGLQVPREVLHQKIAERLEMMITAGLEAEVAGLKAKYPDFFSYQAAQAIGYREFQPYFQGESELAAVGEEIKAHTRQFIKRQDTWFKNQMTVDWLSGSPREQRQQSEKLINAWNV